MLTKNSAQIKIAKITAIATLMAAIISGLTAIIVAVVNQDIIINSLTKILSPKSSIKNENSTVFLIDNSGSIGCKKDNESCPSKKDKPTKETAIYWLNEVRKSIKSKYLQEDFINSNSIGIIEFGGKCKPKSLLQLNKYPKERVEKVLNSINPQDNLAASTPISQAIDLAIKDLNNSSSPNIVIYTDAGANCQEEFASPCVYITRMAISELEPRYIRLNLIFIGYKVKHGDDNMLSCLNKINSQYNNKYLNVSVLRANNKDELLESTKKSIEILESGLIKNSNTVLFTFLSCLVVSGVSLFFWRSLSNYIYIRHHHNSVSSNEKLLLKQDIRSLFQQFLSSWQYYLSIWENYLQNNENINSKDLSLQEELHVALDDYVSAWNKIITRNAINSPQEISVLKSSLDLWEAFLLHNGNPFPKMEEDLLRMIVDLREFLNSYT